MGGAASFSYWTAEEQAENERAEQRMLSAKDFILDFVYYGIPVRSGKKSWDPSSPLCFEVDPKVIEEAMLGTGEVQKTMLATVPSTVIVNKKGIVQIAFMMETTVEYTMDVKDISNALELDLEVVDFGSHYVPTPDPPYLVKAEKTCMHLGWKLPQPAGIAQQCEVQYAIVSSRRLPRVEEYLNRIEEIRAGHGEDFIIRKGKDKNRDVYRTLESDDDPYGLGVCPLTFRPLTNRHYNKPNFFNFSFVEKELRPGDMLVFRLRYMNHRAWSQFGYPSAICKTLPDKPSTCAQPVSSHVTSTSVQLFWVPPSRDNGAPVLKYHLRAKSTGGDWVNLYIGSNTSFLATDLHPEFAYSFEIAAENSVGRSLWSQPMTVTTPKRHDKPRPRDPDSFEWVMALQFRDAWREMWDPQTEMVFYFNVITGTRQLEVPDALKNDLIAPREGGEEEEDGARMETEAEKEHRLEIDFRKKRYRLLRTVHTVSAKAGGSPNKAAEFKKVKLSRNSLLRDGFQKIAKCPPADMKRKIKFEFEGEDAIDSGGVGKEAFLLLSRALVRYCGPAHRGFLQGLGETGGLFFIDHDSTKDTADLLSTKKHKDGSDMIHPSHRVDEKSQTELTSVSAPLLSRFLGRLLAKAVYDRQLVDVPISTLLLRHVLGHMAEEEEREREKAKVKEGAQHQPGQGKNHVTSATDAAAKDEEKKERRGYEDKEEEEEEEEEEGGVSTTNLLLLLKDLDPELFNSLTWMLENDITDIVYEKFSVVIRSVKKSPNKQNQDMKGGSEVREARASFDRVVAKDAGEKEQGPQVKYEEVALCPNGKNIDVTNDNKEKYARLLVRWKTHYSVSALLDPFLQGFYEIIPLSLLRESEITTEELLAMLNGKPRVDVDDLRAYCIYQGRSGKQRRVGVMDGEGEIGEEGGDDDYQDRDGDEDDGNEEEIPFGDNHETVVWFWQCMRDFKQEDARAVLSFFTGSSRVPVDGYEPPLNLTEGVDMDNDALPKAHTCFNQIVLPKYSSMALMGRKLLFAATESQGFQFG